MTELLHVSAQGCMKHLRFVPQWIGIHTVELCHRYLLATILVRSRLDGGNRYEVTFVQSD